MSSFRAHQRGTVLFYGSPGVRVESSNRKGGNRNENERQFRKKLCGILFASLFCRYDGCASIC
ncbi:MAG TPA: hypothetical protein DEP43_01875 [Ruminococcaceae bacterium]|nr:hypothetical protein [Oscillospiraceae bacterium]